jgi:hypothetical protein
VRVVGVGYHVHDGEQRDRDGLGEVEELRGLVEDRVGVAQVGVDVLGGTRLVAGEQRAGVGEDDRIVVRVHDQGLWRDGLGDLVCVACRRDAGADVEELADARLPGEVADDPPEECPVRPHGEGHIRPRLEPCLNRRPVGGVVVLAAQLIIVHTLHAAGIVCV